MVVDYIKLQLFGFSSDWARKISTVRKWRKKREIRNREHVEEKMPQWE